MINQNTLDELNRLGFGADVDALEAYVASLQDAHGLGKSIVTDTVYDQHYRLLKELRTESYVFTRNWEVDDNELGEYDSILTKYGMKSIITIQNMMDLYKFKDALRDRSVRLIASIKLNGHAIRAVYHNGRLVNGSTRGRYKKGRDITRHLKAVLPNYVEEWKDKRLLEVRGEMLVSFKNFEYLYNLKTPLSAVTSLVRESVTNEELQYLSCVCYKVISDNPEDFNFESLSDEYEHLDSVGFKIPPFVTIDDTDYYNFDGTIEQLLEHFGELADNGELEYSTDGVVVSVDDLETFYSFGIDGNAYLGNFALKMGRHWESNIYSSRILEVKFVYGKKYLTPKAIIEPVVTVTGSEVTTVPLYNVGVMERYQYIPGNEIFFKYGGEMGVTCVTPSGETISGA